MPTTLTWDLIDGSTASVARDGYKVTRSAIISGVTGDANARLLNALDDAALPNLGDAHPSNSDLKLESISASPETSDQVRLTLTYAPLRNQIVADDSATPQITVETTVQEVDTNLTEAGAIMTVTYDSDTQTGIVRKFVPQTILRYSRLETADPLTKSVAYTGTVNSGAFKGCAAGTCLCLGITGRSDDGGDSWNVEYVFQYNPNGFQATVAYVDPASGVPPGDITFGPPANGIVNYDIYSSTDFGSLNL